MNHLFLLLGFVLYGLLGSPTPDAPNYIELLIFICLLAGFWPYLLKRIQNLHTLRPSHYFFLFFMALVPLIIGTAANHQASDIGRDYISLGFLLLPLLALKENAPTLNKTILLGIGFIALAFTLRSLVPALNITPSPFERLYLTNSPLLLFAAIYGIGYALNNIKHIYLMLPAAIIFCALVYLVTTQNEQRATVFLLLTGAAACYIATFYKKPFFYLSLGIGLVALMFIAIEPLQTSFENLYHKHIFVGTNNRDMEWQAIMGAWQLNPLSFLWGNGWGARLLSSAAGPTGVNFVHGLLPNLLFKTGVMGLLLSLGYFYGIVRQFTKERPQAFPIIATALPVFLMLTLDGSYKSLDFGLLLLFISTYKFSGNKEAPKERESVGIFLQKA